MGWPLVPLGEILVERKERVGTIDADGLPLLGVSNKAGLHRSQMPRIADMSRYLRVKKQWFAYNPMRVNVGSIGWAYSEELAGVISPDYVVFSCTPQIDPNLVYWFLTSRRGLQAINFQTAGSVRERLYFGSLARVAMPIPPIGEQRRLVEQIAELTSKAQTAERLARVAMSEKDQLFSAIVAEMSGKAIESHGSEPLENLTTFIGDMNHEMPPAVTEGVPLISPKDFQSHWSIDFSGAKRISPDDFARHAVKCKPQRNDILMARYGTIGAARFVDTDEKFLASYSIAVIRPNVDRVLPRFLFWMVTSRHIQEQATLGIRGSGMADLGLKTIRRFMIPIVERQEQVAFVERLDGLLEKTSRLTKLSGAAVEEIRSLAPSILNQAFAGELQL